MNIPVSEVMTKMPHTIGPEQKIQKAIEMMNEHGFRHLPVQIGGKLVGILTDRDLKLASTFEGALDYPVEEVMIPDPYFVEPETQLSEVVGQMAEHKYGAAVVAKDGHVVGIFTAIDALRVLQRKLSE